MLCLLCALCNVAFAAPVYIDVLADFPAYPYNTSAYVNTAGDFVGCGPTSGAMFMAYFEHHFGATGLLTNPVAGVDEGLDTAWVLNSASYLDTSGVAGPFPNGFGSVLNIKPGLEGYASDRGHEIQVMAHAPPGAAPGTPWYDSYQPDTNYGPYGVAWIDDGIFWRHLGGTDFDIDADDFCDFVGPKLSAGICVMLTVDKDDVEGGDHWIPCVGYDKDAGIYYYYNTYDTTLHSAPIIGADATPVAGDYAITFVRTIDYIGSLAAVTIESCDSTGTKKDTFQPSDEVYATGTGYQPSTTYDIFLVEDVTWVDGMAIPPRVLGTTPSVTSDGAGNIPATLMWDDPLVLGKYDIVVDVDGDGLYYAESDALDDMDIEVTAGLLIIPEVALGTIMVLAAMVLALVVYVAVPKWKRKRTRLNP